MVIWKRNNGEEKKVIKDIFSNIGLYKIFLYSQTKTLAIASSCLFCWTWKLYLHLILISVIHRLSKFPVFLYEFLKSYNLKPMTIMIFALTPSAFVNKITLSCQRFNHLEMLLPSTQKELKSFTTYCHFGVFEGNSLSFQ